MLRQRVQPKVIGQDWIPNGDMACDALVETAVRKDPERSCEMLLAVQTLFLKGLELGIPATIVNSVQPQSRGCGLLGDGDHLRWRHVLGIR